ncbi:F0F1 ATP synthase subunit B [Alkalihalobacillus trypoxylicola]|uniref:ATP synthase subunit b n=1 Tax=Alkalihalobacillus trypoxylicola TaxID=519424 RepID=A0A161PAQ4_9BACI|nr:F0F1 ATP synthase subunit B [Alkalihalobacillus trypoxylicola]KYG29222.1 ATP synthase F0F1 subunit B [Alkalihalobacillus trypoxylicola]GAF65060.1 F0F1 ATP synthase subunit B [Bacillus sp. TS-2]
MSFELFGFVVPLGSILFQLAAFLTLLFFISKFALKPLLGVMEKREQMVSDQIENAEARSKEAEQYIKDQRIALEEARNEASEIIQNAKKLSEQQGQEILEQARVNAERIKDSALAEIQREKEHAVSELREQVASLSVLVATKVIEKELDEKEQEKLIQDYINEVGGKL